MKFRSKFYLKEREGEERVREKFLFWPRNFGETYYKWFEWEAVVERVEKIETGIGCPEWRWVEVGFAGEADDRKYQMGA
ncbi:MAG: hypothetical protein SWH61_16615 [Thermodesulfobacteriota bacterium]|nr:hypothetical protein [Thermodesulfobacteriota bacterium]